MQAHSVTAGTAGSRPAAAAAPGRLVIDAPTRMFHWLFALSFLGAYLTADGERWRLLHVTLGYTMAGLLAFRVLYGLFGPRQARLAMLWRKVAGLPQWGRAAVAGRSLAAVNWRQGQNLLMGVAIVLLLALVVPLTLSGYGTYNEWVGSDLLEELHEFFGNALLAVVLAHLALLALLSVVRRRNQATPMVTGRMPGSGPDLVQKNRAWLAGLLLLAVLSYGAWEWQQSPNGLFASAGNTAQHDRDDDD